MFQKKAVAAEISNLMLEFGSKLDASIVLVQQECDEEESKAYRSAIGKIMGEMLLEVMNPIYARYPELTPDKLRRSPRK